MHRCSVHALSGIVGVGGCQCHCACRSTRRVCTRIIQRRQESKLASYQLPSDVLLVDLYDRHCGRASDGFRNTSDPVQRDFTHLFIESNHLAPVHVSCSRTERHFVIHCGNRDVRRLTHSYARKLGQNVGVRELAYTAAITSMPYELDQCTRKSVLSRYHQTTTGGCALSFLTL